jgi:hypothetical protein
LVDAADAVRAVKSSQIAGKWIWRTKHMSDRARTYQRFISGRSDDLVYEIGEFSFYGFNASLPIFTMLTKSLTSFQNIKVTVSENIRFINPGVNWERVVCPNCRTVIEPSWWEQVMDKTYESGFSNLAIISPCCGVETSLNELQYE